MSDYVKELRKKVGHSPILVPHAVIILFNLNKEVLIEERSDDGYFDFPGGAIEPDEDASDAAKRELLEETGIVADELQFFKLYTGPITYYKYRNGDEIYGVDAVFTCNAFHGKLSPQKGEVNRLFFMSIDDIPKEKLNPRNRQIIVDLKKKEQR